MRLLRALRIGLGVGLGVGLGLGLGSGLGLGLGSTPNLPSSSTSRGQQAMPESEVDTAAAACAARGASMPSSSSIAAARLFRLASMCAADTRKWSGAAVKACTPGPSGGSSPSQLGLGLG